MLKARSAKFISHAQTQTQNMILKLVLTQTGSSTKNGRKKWPKIKIMLNVPPGTVFADEIPEGFLGHVGVPDDEVLRELDVGGKQREGEEQHAEEIKLIVLQHAGQDALPLQNHRDDIDRRERRPTRSCEKKYMP